jgi:hypothetical protein
MTEEPGVFEFPVFLNLIRDDADRVARAATRFLTAGSVDDILHRESTVSAGFALFGRVRLQ